MSKKNKKNPPRNPCDNVKNKRGNETIEDQRDEYDGVGMAGEQTIEYRQMWEFIVVISVTTHFS